MPFLSPQVALNFGTCQVSPVVSREGVAIDLGSFNYEPFCKACIHCSETFDYRKALASKFVNPHESESISCQKITFVVCLLEPGRRVNNLIQHNSKLTCTLFSPGE